MDNISINASHPLDLAQLINAAQQHLKTLGYHNGTQQLYEKNWNRLRQYAEDVAGTNQYSEMLAENFLASLGLSPSTQPAKNHQLGHCVRALRLLSEFHLHGWFHHWRPRALKPSLTPAFEQVSTAYENACRMAGIRERTISSRKFLIRKFAEFLGSRQITETTELNAAVVSDFVAAQSRYNANTVCLLVRNLRLFLRFLHQSGYHTHDLSTTLPRVPGRYRDLLPTTWTTEDVARLLACVDRDSPVGKRDYVILLLAARLGMRTGDIVTLRLDHIDWDNGRIRKVQSKTGVILELPLLEDVGRALIDYLKYGRPKSSYREIFLRCVVPIRPFSNGSALFSIIESYRRRAGIPLLPESRRGMHALRHTVASHLLEQGTPLHIISGVLGHLDANSTRVYTKVDVERLRQCALDNAEVPHA